MKATLQEAIGLAAATVNRTCPGRASHVNQQATVRDMFSILRQAGTSRIEERLAAQYAMTADVPIASVAIDSIGEHAAALRGGKVVPVGSVEFVRTAMALSGVAEPGNLSYPECLFPWLRRDVVQREAGGIQGRWFVKPTTTKRFTGFVVDTRVKVDDLSRHDREQYTAFRALEKETRVWVSTPVTWLSEYRYYVIDGVVRGEGRYDDGEDEMPVPDVEMVGEMATVMARSENAPVTFGLDVGVLDTGETALIECNDAWALGYYRGTLGYRDYIEMLWRRWAQLSGT